MDNLTEKYVLELVKNLKDEPNPAFDIFKKNGEVASCNFIARTTGVVSGVDVVQLFYKKLSSKVSFKILKENGKFVKCPMIKESPVSVECKVKEVRELGSHHMFIADVLAVHVDDKYMNEKNKFCLEKAEPIVYSHGAYLMTGDVLGTFGFSVKKNEK